MAETIQIERKGSVAVLALNRPDNGNAVNVDLVDAFLNRILDCDADNDIRAVVLTGRGKMFCAGGDVTEFAKAGDAVPALVKRLTAPLHAGLSRLRQMEKPLITAINGPAAGAGLGLALCGDLALAARSAKFVAAYDGLGLTPDAGLTWLLPRLVGMRQAQRILLEGVRLDADSAAEIGLISRVVESEALLSHAIETAERLADGPIRAWSQTRRLLDKSYDSSFERQLEEEAQTISRTAAGAEAREGIRAFLDKRRPLFKGDPAI